MSSPASNLIPGTIARAALAWDGMDPVQRAAIMLLGGKRELREPAQLPRWMMLDEPERIAALFGLRRAAALGAQATRVLDGE